MELEQNYVPSSHTRHDRLKRRYSPDLQAHYDDTMHITFIPKTCRKMCTSTRSDVSSRVRLTGIFCRCHVRCRRTLYRWRVTTALSQSALFAFCVLFSLCFLSFSFASFSFFSSLSFFLRSFSSFLSYFNFSASFFFSFSLPTAFQKSHLQLEL